MFVMLKYRLFTAISLLTVGTLLITSFFIAKAIVGILPSAGRWAGLAFLICLGLAIVFSALGWDKKKHDEVEDYEA